MANSINLTEDLSELTTVSQKTFERFEKVIIKIIGNAIREGELSGEGITDVVSGIGTISIKHEGDEMRFRFTPSQKLRETAVSMTRDETDPIELSLETALADKLINTYKDLM